MKYSISFLACFFSLFLSAQTESQSVNQDHNIQFRSKLNYPGKLSNIWGHVDSAGNEYALVGTDYGFSVVDVTNPDTVNEVWGIAYNNNMWREVKSWNNHAYIVNEKDSGLLIVDLSGLPDSTNLPFTFYMGDTMPFKTSHTIFIDENGIMYLFGRNGFARGALVYDLKPDPMHPTELGMIDDFYIHDGFVRGDTLWAAAIYEGKIYAYDMSNKQNPVILGSFSTPGIFAHNCWPSDDNNYLYTTDEIAGGYIGSFDVSDVTDAKELDRFKIAHPDEPIPHNTHFYNNYLVNAYYTQGVVILDATRPENLVKVGQYNTCRFYIKGFHGAWGVYPYLPSGNILVSDMEEGLVVLTPNYVRAAYLEGSIRDSATGMPLADAFISIVGGNQTDRSLSLGRYKSGTDSTGIFSVRVSRQGYYEKTVTGVSLVQGLITHLDVDLKKAVSTVNETESSAKLSIFPNPTNGNFTVSFDDLALGDVHISVSNVLGEIIYQNKFSISQQQQQININLSISSIGVYFVHVKAENFNRVERLMLNR
jgi:choice-of-anchor B domain-containing protein